MSVGGSADRMASQLTAVGNADAKFWAAGAEGERRVAAVLDGLPPAWTCLHDRLLEPGLTEVNLDHIAIGPAGVYSIDTKMWGGIVDVWEGSLFRHKAGAGGVVTHESMAREVDKVKWLADVMAATLGIIVYPVLCLASSRPGGLSEPTLVRGVMIVPVAKLAAWLTGLPHTMLVGDMLNVAGRCLPAFPATDTDPRALLSRGRASLRTRELVGSRGLASRRYNTGRTRPMPSRPRGRGYVSPNLGSQSGCLMTVLVMVLMGILAVVH